MALRLLNLALPVEHRPEDIERMICQRLAVTPDAIKTWRVERRSLDARKRENIRLIYSVIIEAADEPSLLYQLSEGKLEQYIAPEPFTVSPGSEPLGERPVVIGAGPAGLFAALTLARNGYRPLVIERGAPVKDRIMDVGKFLTRRELNPESNFLFGEGGAGAFSDGKLTTRGKGNLVGEVLREMVACGAPEDILVNARPHLGSNGVRKMVTKLRQKIEEAGGEFRFGARVSKLLLNGDKVNGVRCGSENISAGAVVLAIGHSARDTYRALFAQGVAMERKTFQFGLRIEHNQKFIDGAMFAKMAGHPKLGAAEYSLVSRGRDQIKPVFTFCMCPGGEIVPATTQAGTISTNGMSWSARSSRWGNSALMTSLAPEEFEREGVLAGIELQEELERRCFKVSGGDFHVPAQTAANFMRRQYVKEVPATSYRLGVTPVEWSRLLPPNVGRSIFEALKYFERIMPGFVSGQAVLLGPETRGSSPVRIVRHEETLESLSHGRLYPVGEGAGYAGGIVSAAADGLNIARALISKFSPVV